MKYLLCVLLFPLAIYSQHSNFGLRLSLHSTISSTELPFINSGENDGGGVYLNYEYTLPNYGLLFEIGGASLAMPQKTTIYRSATINSQQYIIHEDGAEYSSEKIWGFGFYPELFFLNENSPLRLFAAVGPGFYVYPITYKHSFLFSRYENRQYEWRFTPGLRLGLKWRLSKGAIIKFQSQGDAALGFKPEYDNNLVDKRIFFWGGSFGLSVQL